MNETIKLSDELMTLLSQGEFEAVLKRVKFLESNVQAAVDEADRLRHGVGVEGDFVCPDSLALSDAKGKMEAARTAANSLLEQFERFRANGRTDDQMGLQSIGMLFQTLFSLLSQGAPLLETVVAYECKHGVIRPDDACVKCVKEEAAAAWSSFQGYITATPTVPQRRVGPKWGTPEWHKAHPIFGTDMQKPVLPLATELRKELIQIRGHFSDLELAYPGYAQQFRDIQGLLTCGISSLYHTIHGDREREHLNNLYEEKKKADDKLCPLCKHKMGKHTAKADGTINDCSHGWDNTGSGCQCPEKEE